MKFNIFEEFLRRDLVLVKLYVYDTEKLVPAITELIFLKLHSKQSMLILGRHKWMKYKVSMSMYG